MGNSLVQWRAAIGGFCSRICSSGWGKSVSSKSKFSHASQLLLILQLMSITLIKEEVAEERHGFKTKRKLGSPMHQQRSWQSLTLYNSKRAGHVTPLRLKKKSKTSSPSSPCTPFSKHFLERFPEALEKHNLLNKK